MRAASIVLCTTVVCVVLPRTVCAQVTLTGASYTENFDQLALASPAGWTLYTGATATSLGTEASYTAAPTSWATSTGNFRNVAAADLDSGASAGQQAEADDRAWGVRQTGSFGDPGAAFVFHFDATGFAAVAFSLNLMLLSSQSNSTVWTLDYSIDGGTTWTVLTTWSDPGVFGTSVVASGGPVTAFTNQPNARLRFAALSAATGSGTRDTVAIDNLELSYQAVPEPATVTLLAGVAALLGAAVRRRCIRNGRRRELRPKPIVG